MTVDDIIFIFRGVVPIGRTTVSKTVCWGFESLRPCTLTMKIFYFILGCILSITAVGQTVHGISAKSYIVTELDGTIVLQKDILTPRPIASITKLLIAEQVVPNISTTNSVIIGSADLASRTSHSRLRLNSELREDQLVRLSLISSNNSAVYALARTHGTEKVISSVNRIAQERGLSSIFIEEPSGLSANNQANVADLAKFVALVHDTDTAKISTEPTVSIGKNIFKSTNPLLAKPGWNFGVSKTGFINAAGGCLATIVEIGGRQVVVVILGSANTKTRWLDLIKIRLFLAETDVFWSPKITLKGKK